MVAGIETFGGHAAFASRGEPGWHNLGTVFDQTKVISTASMLDLAYLSRWNVRVEELITAARTKIPSYEVVRDNPFDGGLDRLGVVKKRYKVYQNEELFSFGDDIVDGGGQWETAGSIKDGAVVFGSLLIDKDVIIGAGSADDLVKIYLLVNTSHDGSMSIQASVTPTRVVCQNTLQFALAANPQSFKIRHTQTMDGRLIEARKALGLTFAYADEFAAEMEKLYQTAVTDNQFDAIIASLYPEPESDVKGSVAKWEAKRDTLFDIWNDSAEGPATTGASRGTAWGALNALTEREDWYRNPRSGNTDNLFAAQAGFDPATLVSKQNILAAVKAAV
jgi:phage/plasmid-like protein (TIGR03299 family)